MIAQGTEGRNVSVGVVDDDGDTCLYFSDLLQATSGFSCCGCFTSASRALSCLPGLDADLVLMDIRMPDLDGIECTKRLKNALPRLKIVMVTGVHDVRSMDECLKAGAAAYLIKPITADQFVATLKFVATKEPQPAQQGNELNLAGSATSSTNSPHLTPRDSEVVQLMAQGLLNKEIADRLGMSYSAVHKHQHNIFRKMRVRNRTEAVRKWLNSNPSS